MNRLFSKLADTASFVVANMATWGWTLPSVRQLADQRAGSGCLWKCEYGLTGCRVTCERVSSDILSS